MPATLVHVTHPSMPSAVLPVPDTALSTWQTRGWTLTADPATFLPVTRFMQMFGVPGGGQVPLWDAGDGWWEGGPAAGSDRVPHDDLMVNVLHHGATGDGSTVDTAAVQAAESLSRSTGRPLYFPGGRTYVVDVTPGQTRLVVIGSGTHWVGGPGATVKVKSGAGNYFAVLGPVGATYGGNVENVRIDGVAFDLNTAGNPVAATLNTAKQPRALFGEPTDYATYPYMPRLVLAAVGGDDISFVRCTVRDAACIQVLYLGGYDSKHVRVEGCFFTGIGAAGAFHDHSTVYVNARFGIQVNHNVFVANAPGSNGARCAVETHGGGQSVVGNSCRDYAKFANVTGWCDDTETVGVVVANNQVKGASWGIDLWSYNANAGQYGLRDVVVAHNTIEIDRDTWVPTILAYHTAAGTTAVVNNIGISTNPTSTAPYENVLIQGNVIRYKSVALPYVNSSEQNSCGIFVWAASPYAIRNHEVRVLDNAVLDPPGAGVRIQAKVTGLTVARNRVRNPGSLVDAGMSAYYRGFVVHATNTDGELMYDGAQFYDNDVTDNRVTPSAVGHLLFFDTAATQFRNVVVGRRTGTHGQVTAPTNGTVHTYGHGPATATGVGRWYGAPGVRALTSSDVNGLPADGWEFHTVVEFPEPTWVDALAVEVTTVGTTGALLRLGVRALAVGVPAKLRYDAGTVSGEALGAQQVTFTAVQMPAGLVALTCAFQGAPATKPVLRAASGELVGGSTTAATALSAAGAAGFLSSGSTGALPAALGSTAGRATHPPLVVYRRSA